MCNSNGDIRDGNNHYLGKVESDGDIRDSNNSYLGKIESSGTVRNRNNSYMGKVDSDGTVRNSNNSVIGYAKGVSMKYAAIYFFFDLFLCTFLMNCAKWKKCLNKKCKLQTNVRTFL